MNNNSPFMDNLRHLFGECDRDQSGSLGPDEFKELCDKIGLSREMADETFKRLDIDQNCQITFDEFAAGFNQYKEQQTRTSLPSVASPTTSGPTGRGSRTPPRFAQTTSNTQQQNRLPSSPVTRRAQSRASPSGGGGGGGGNGGANVSLGSTGSSSNLTTSGRSTSSSGAGAGRCFSSSDLSSSYDLSQQSLSHQHNQHEHQTTQDEMVVYSSDLIEDSGEQASCSGQFGSMLSSNGSFNQMKTMQDLLECVQKLQSENQILTQIFFKDKREREEYISQLGEEFDQQLREVEERANKRARDELELEKKRLKEMMQTEKETLQHHYQTLEKIGKMVKTSAASGTPLDGEGFSKVKSQLEDTFMENRQLKKSLMDTKTDVALIWKEMEKLKKHYEDKLCNAYEKQKETQHECDHIKLQLDLMKDSNRKLQDASDVITNYITDKVEPVIKVAQMDPNDDPNEVSLNHLTIGQHQSAANSRRGSILSEYLNKQNNDDDEENDEDDDDENDDNDLACGESLSMGSSSNGRQRTPTGTTLLKRMNGLETSLSRNQRFNQSTSSSSTTASDNNNLLNVPSARATTTAKTQSTSINTSTPSKTTPANSQSSAEASKRLVEANKLQPAAQTKVENSVQTGKQQPTGNKQAASGSEQPSTRSSLKNFSRHFMLGNRSQSDAKPKETIAELAEVKSLSADDADDPIIEPSDGPSVATFNIILVGDSFVGKSSFAARFIEGSFVQGLISNCSIDFKTKCYKVDGINYTVNLWDTAGQERFRSITASYFRKADGIILMYDVTDKRSYLNVRNWMSTIAGTAAENVAVLLVGNKIDLRVNDNKSSFVPTEEGFGLAREYDIVFLETSVKTGTNLLPSMGKLIRLIAKNNTAEEEDSDRIRLSDKGRSFNCMPKNC